MLFKDNSPTVQRHVGRNKNIARLQKPALSSSHQVVKLLSCSHQNISHVEIFFYSFVTVLVVTRETAPLLTSDMGKKTVSVLAQSFYVPQRANAGKYSPYPPWCILKVRLLLMLKSVYFSRKNLINFIGWFFFFWHVSSLVGWTFSQNFSSLALTVCDLWYCEDLEEKDELIIELMTRLFIEQPRLHRVC